MLTLVLILGFGALWVVGKVMVTPEQREAAKKREFERKISARTQDELDLAIKGVTARCEWRKVGGSAVADITIENSNDTAVRDVLINFHFRSDSGSHLGTLSHTIYQVIPASGSVKLSNFKIGAVNQQATNLRTSVLGATVIKSSSQKQ